MTDRQDLMTEIADEEARLAALKAEVEESSARLAALRKKLAAELPARIVVPTPLAPEAPPAAMTNTAKVAVFRSLFRGRKDVFPRRHQLSMESYDRLFPNQDTVPKGRSPPSRTQSPTRSTACASPRRSRHG